MPRPRRYEPGRASASAVARDLTGCGIFKRDGRRDGSARFRRVTDAKQPPARIFLPLGLGGEQFLTVSRPRTRYHQVRPFFVRFFLTTRKNLTDSWRR